MAGVIDETKPCRQIGRIAIGDESVIDGKRVKQRRKKERRQQQDARCQQVRPLLEDWHSQLSQVVIA